MPDPPSTALADGLPAHLELDCDPRSASRARRFLLDTLADHVIDDVRDTAVLLTCELVTNAVEHADSGCALRISLDMSDTLRVEVCDGTPGFAVPSPTDEVLRESGRGLMLLDALALEWGNEATSDGKMIWFLLLLEPDAAGTGLPERTDELAE